MKKYFYYIVVILLFSVFIFFVLKKEDKVEYLISVSNRNFKIHETVINDKIYLNIKDFDIEFNYLVDNIGKKVLKDIQYVEASDAKCLFLTFIDNSTSNDLICNNSNQNYLYSSLRTNDESLDRFYDNLVKLGHIKENLNDISNYKEIGNYKVYVNNIKDDYSIALTNYKGLYLLKSNEIKEVSLFDKDIYNQKVKAFISNKYIIADYDQKYEFSNFYVYDLDKEKKDLIKTNYEISFNSGFVITSTNIVYLRDLDNNKMYKIDIDEKTVTLESSKKDISNEFIDGYEIIKKTNNNYYLKKDNNLYISVLDEIDNLYLLFNLDDKENISISDKSICWVQNNNVVCYKNGYINLVYSNEFNFNDSIMFYTY